MLFQLFMKLNTISGITPHTNFAKRSLLVNSFFYSQYNYLQLAWMCQTNNNKINRLHKISLRLNYNDKRKHLSRIYYRSVSVHHRNLRALAVELFKIFKGLSPIFFRISFSCKTTKSAQYENVFIFCYVLCQNCQL